MGYMKLDAIPEARYLCDTRDDLSILLPRPRLGDTCWVIEEAAKYMCNSDGEWIKQVNSTINNNGSTTDLAGYATESYVNEKIGNLISSAPENLDTLAELATALKDNNNILEVLNEVIDNKAEKTDIPDISGLQEKGDYALKSDIPFVGNMPNIHPVYLAEKAVRNTLPDLNNIAENGTYMFYLENTSLTSHIPANMPEEEKKYLLAIPAKDWRAYELQCIKSELNPYVVRVQRLYEIRYGEYYYERYHHTSWGEWRKVSTRNEKAGKKCACFGDSITWYDGQKYTWGKAKGEKAVGYETYLRKEFGMIVDNFGFSGFTAPQIVAELMKTDLTTYNYLTLTSGANDTRCSTPLGEIAPIGSEFDTSTYYGAIQAAIEYAIGQNNDIKIVLMTPIKGWCYAGGFDPVKEEDGEIPEELADAIKAIGKLYSLPVCDWYNESGLNILTRNIYINDPEPPENTLYSFHPSALLFERMSKLLIETFKKI